MRLFTFSLSRCAHSPSNTFEFCGFFSSSSNTKWINVWKIFPFRSCACACRKHSRGDEAKMAKYSHAKNNRRCATRNKTIQTKTVEFLFKCALRQPINHPTSWPKRFGAHTKELCATAKCEQARKFHTIVIRTSTKTA